MKKLAIGITGGIGSGKSSGSGRMLALSYLKNGFGGVVLTGKIDEVNFWRMDFFNGRSSRNLGTKYS